MTWYVVVRSCEKYPEFPWLIFCAAAGGYVGAFKSEADAKLCCLKFNEETANRIQRERDWMEYSGLVG